MLRIWRLTRATLRRVSTWRRSSFMRPTSRSSHWSTNTRSNRITITMVTLNRPACITVVACDATTSFHLP